MQIAPTAEEAKALRMFRGPASELSPPEQFLLVMAAVPRLISKVREEERSGGVFWGGEDWACVGCGWYCTNWTGMRATDSGWGCVLSG